MGIKYAGTVPRRVRRARCPAEPSRLTRRVRPASGSPGGRPQPVRMVGRGVPPSRRTCGDCPRGAKTLNPSNLQTLALSPCLGRVEMLKFSRLRKLTENGLRCNSHNKPAGRVKSKLEKFLNFLTGAWNFLRREGFYRVEEGLRPNAQNRAAAEVPAKTKGRHERI